jgi:amino acid transporter
MAAAAAETRNPRRNIPKAAKRIFIRVLLFYVLSIFIVTLIVPSNNKLLLHSTGNASQSPFVIVATAAGIKVVPHIVNAIVLTSAWSSGNSTMLVSSFFLFSDVLEKCASCLLYQSPRLGQGYSTVLLVKAMLRESS